MSSPAVDLKEWWQENDGHYSGRSWYDYRHLLAEVVRYGAEPPLLDVGCGYGFLVECARRFGVPAIGIEASDIALAEGRIRHPQADLRQWLAGTPLPCADGSIGVTMLNQVIDHFTLDENRRLFDDLRRVLKPGGVLIAHSPSRFNRFDTDTGHVTFFSPREFRAFVADAGFDVVAQPFVPQPVLGGGVGWQAVRLFTHFFKPERLAATIDIVAVKR